MEEGERITLREQVGAATELKLQRQQLERQLQQLARRTGKKMPAPPPALALASAISVPACGAPSDRGTASCDDDYDEDDYEEETSSASDDEAGTSGGAQQAQTWAADPDTRAMLQAAAAVVQQKQQQQQQPQEQPMREIQHTDVDLGKNDEKGEDEGEDAGGGYADATDSDEDSWSTDFDKDYIGEDEDERLQQPACAVALSGSASLPALTTNGSEDANENVDGLPTQSQPRARKANTKTKSRKAAQQKARRQQNQVLAALYS